MLQKNKYLQTDHLSTDLRGKSVRGGFITVSFQCIQFVLNLVSVVILGRLLSPEDYGLVGMVAAVTGFVSLLSEGGLSTATIQKQEISHDQVSTLFWINVVLGVFMSLLVMPLSPLVTWFYGEPRLLLLTSIIGGNFALAGLGVQHRAILARQMNYISLGLVATSAQIFSLIVASLAAWFGWGVWSLVALLYTSSAVNVAGSWIACRWRPSLPRRGVGIKEMISFGAFVSLNGVVYTMVKSLESLLLGRIGGAEQLGYYARAGALVQNPMQQLMGPLGSVAIPALSRVASEPERFRQAFLLLCELIAITVVPAVTFLVVTSDWIVTILLGPRWIQLAPLAALMALGAFASPLAAAGTWALTTQQKGRELFRWSIVHSILIAIAIVAGLSWGAVGVASMVAISGILIRTPFLFWTVAQNTPIKQMDVYVTILPPIAYSVMVSIMIWLFRLAFPIKSPFIGLSCTIAISATLYAFGLIFSARGRKIIGVLNDFRSRLTTTR